MWIRWTVKLVLDGLNLKKSVCGYGDELNVQLKFGDDTPRRGTSQWFEWGAFSGWEEAFSAGGFCPVEGAFSSWG